MGCRRQRPINRPRHTVLEKGASHMEQIDPRALRNVLGCYATGVAIITARTPGGEHVGVTVNSFSSVSLDPPLILFSVARNTNVFRSLKEARNFSVNILAHNQQSLSSMFAKPSTADFKKSVFTEGHNGCALFHDSLAQLECDKEAEIDGGDHLVFLGRVTNCHLRTPTKPLLFFRGAYGTYSRDQLRALPPADSSLSEFSVTGWG